MRGSREISLVPSLHRASTDALIDGNFVRFTLEITWKEFHRNRGNPWRIMEKSRDPGI